MVGTEEASVSQCCSTSGSGALKQAQELRCCSINGAIETS
jgi:hypothetical protein